MTTPLDAAIAYVDRGWSVIPIRAGEKRPLIEWAQYQDQRSDKQQLRQWFRETTDANIAVVTGQVSDLVVVDIDTQVPARTVNGIQTMFPTPYVVRTPSGGFHLYYAYPIDVEIRNSAGAGLDIRAQGGYVVAPPSHSTKYDRGYQWADEISEQTLPSFSPKLLEKIERLRQQLQPPEASTSDASDGWVSDLLAGVRKGERAASCARLAGYFLAKGVPADVVISQLEQWNERNEQPEDDLYTDADVERCVRSIADTEARRVRADGTPESDDQLTFVAFADYMAEWGGQGVTWMIEDWLPDQTIGFAVAAPETFKTWLLLDLAVSVAGGTSFLGHYPVLRSGPVLILQQEDSHP